MYIVAGFYPEPPPEAGLTPPPATLAFASLDQAMQKVRDWIEADELDSNGPMFTEYGLRIEPLPTSRR